MVFLGWNLKKTVVIFKISTLKFVWLQISRKKMSKSETKNVWFEYFWTGIWKKYCHIWNQHPWICLITKYREIMKMPKIGTKKALFAYLWARILKNYCYMWNQQLQISAIAKFCEKNLGPKMSYLSIFDQKCLVRVFLGKNFEKVLSYLKSAPSNFLICKISQKNKNA